MHYKNGIDSLIPQIQSQLEDFQEGSELYRISQKYDDISDLIEMWLDPKVSEKTEIVYTLAELVFDIYRAEQKDEPMINTQVLTETIAKWRFMRTNNPQTPKELKSCKQKLRFILNQRPYDKHASFQQVVGLARVFCGEAVEAHISGFIQEKAQVYLVMLDLYQQNLPEKNLVVEAWLELGQHTYLQLYHAPQAFDGYSRIVPETTTRVEFRDFFTADQNSIHLGFHIPELQDMDYYTR